MQCAYILQIICTCTYYKYMHVTHLIWNPRMTGQKNISSGRRKSGGSSPHPYSAEKRYMSMIVPWDSSQTPSRCWRLVGGWTHRRWGTSQPRPRRTAVRCRRRQLRILAIEIWRIASSSPYWTPSILPTFSFFHRSKQRGASGSAKRVIDWRGSTTHIWSHPALWQKKICHRVVLVRRPSY